MAIHQRRFQAEKSRRSDISQKEKAKSSSQPTKTKSLFLEKRVHG
jgi:hypothetical protein